MKKWLQLWHGLRPKIIDGTTVSLPDTQKNQRTYPQSRSQKPGCGFPLMRLVGVFSLATGVLLDYAKGNKHQHELRLLWKLLDGFKPGDLAVADRGFCSYVLAGLVAGCAGSAACSACISAGRPICAKASAWAKMTGSSPGSSPGWQRPRWLPSPVERFPTEVTVRVVRFTLDVPGYRSESVTLVTTLLDAQSLSRPGNRPTLCPALEYRTVVPGHQDLHGHGVAALQESQDGA